METIQDLLSNSPIGGTIGLKKEIKPYSQLSNRILNPTIVDKLLQDYRDLIDVKYTAWFAKRFYTMPFDLITRCASEARQDSHQNPQRLFAYLIKKRSN